MGEYLQQIGVAGILIILVLDRVFTFVSKQRTARNGTHDAGGQSTDYWRAVGKMVATEALDACAIPILKQQAEILSRLEMRSGQMYDMNLRQGFQVEEVQKSMERLRASSHMANEQLQRIVAKVSESG